MNFDEQRNEALKQYNRDFRHILNIYNNGRPLIGYPCPAKCWFKINPDGTPYNDFTRDVMASEAKYFNTIKDIRKQEQAL